MGMIVVPGQHSTTRIDTAEATILGKKPPEGIIHVVANGFATIRGETTHHLKESAKWKTVAAMQKWRKSQEIEELKQVCEWVRQAHRRYRKPMWLLLVVTKYDLFADDLSIKNDYYPGGRGAVVSMLDELTRQVGSDNFGWQAAAACSWLEPFDWKGHSIPSQLTGLQRDSFITELTKQVLTFCTAEGSRR